MPRKRRFFLAGVPVHVVQRGNNRQAVFFGDSDYRVYLDSLDRAAGEHRCWIHAYALMTNHVHVLMNPGEGEAIRATPQALGRRFVPYIKHRYATGAAERCGRADSRRARSKRRAICSPVTDISSSILYGAEWWISLRTTPGPATVPTPSASATGCSVHTPSTGRSAPMGPSASLPTESSLRHSSVPICSAICALVCKPAHRSERTAFARTSNRPWELK
jgi:REP element-mobilizing transposase RayT